RSGCACRAQGLRLQVSSASSCREERDPRRVKPDLRFLCPLAMGHVVSDRSTARTSHLSLLVGLDDLTAMDFEGGQPAAGVGRPVASMFGPTRVQLGISLAWARGHTWK